MASRFVCLFACLFALGCGAKGPSVATYPISGKVTLNGKPLEGATVNFANKNPDGMSASGITDGEGRFKLTTYVTPNDLRAGAVSGEYVAVISKPVALMTQQNMGSAEAMRTMSDAERQQAMMKQWKMVMNEEKKTMNQPKSEVPEKYSNAKTSPFNNVTVVNGENPPFEFDLTE